MANMHCSGKDIFSSRLERRILTFRNPIPLFVTGAIFIILGVVLFLANVNKVFDHDEHLFVAGGALVSKSLIPYRDFPYFHMPYSALVYGVVFRHTRNLLLAARTLSTIAGLVTVGVLFATAYTLEPLSRANRLALSVGSAGLMVTNPLFIYTTGRAWNQDLSLLFALGAFFIYYRAVTKGDGKTGPFVAGILLGLAIGTRMSFALIAPAFFLSTLHPVVRSRRKVVLWFAFGLGLSLAPVSLLLTSYPQQFLFDNVGFFRVSAEWLRSQATDSSIMTLAGKYRYFRDEVLSKPGNLVLGITYIICTVLLSNRSLLSNLRANFGLTLSMLILPFLVVGSFATMAGGCCRQYFYVLVPFATLGIVFAIAALHAEGRTASGIRVLILGVLLSTVYAHPQYRSLLFGDSMEKWTPLRVHSVSNEIRRHLDYGVVLTLAPIIPLEAGLDIYPEFAPAHFAWRVAHLLPKEQRARLGIVAPNDLTDFLKTRPPRAILTVFEANSSEEPLIAYARANQFRDVTITRFFDEWTGTKVQVRLWISQATRVNGPSPYLGR